MDKSETRIILSFIEGIRYNENKYFEIYRTHFPTVYICYILCNYFTALSWNVTNIVRRGPARSSAHKRNF